jgi:hypothetical protein
VLGGDLLEQVGDTDVERSAVEVEGRLDRRPDVVGVDVAVPDAVATDDDDRVADVPPTLLEGTDVVVGEVAQEHHLVTLLADVELAVDPRRSVGDGVERHADDAAACFRPRVGEVFAVDHVQGGVEEQQEPGAAGIDHSGVLEHRQQVRRPVEGGAAAIACGTQHLAESAA